MDSDESTLSIIMPLWYRMCGSASRYQHSQDGLPGLRVWSLRHHEVMEQIQRFSFSMAWNVCWTVDFCQHWLGAESVLYFSFWSNDPGMKWIKFCEERNLWKVWAIPGELGFYFPPQSLATWGLTTRTNTKIPNSQPIDFEAMSIVQGGAGAKGLRRKVWTRIKILNPNIRFIVAILREPFKNYLADFVR